MVFFLNWLLYLRRLVIFALCIVVPASAFSTSPLDSIQLAPVLVKGSVPERFLAGQKYRKIDDRTLTHFQFSSLSDLLSITTPLAIKNYGPGQLATISFRGTSASHTAVMWNGVNINQPTLGQTDFSSIAMGSFDEIGIQYGSSSSVTGTDAVGGSIHLNTTHRLDEGFSAQVGHSQGSFQNHSSQIQVRYGRTFHPNWHFSSSTKIALAKLSNHFKESYREGYPMSVARTDRRALIQDFYLKSRKNHLVSAHIWLSDHNAVLQPDRIDVREKTHTKAYRTLVKYSFRNWEFRSSWIRDILNYGKGDYSSMSLATTDRTGLLINKEWEGNWGNNLSYALRSGAELTHIATRVTGYQKNYITELRTDLFTAARLRAYEKWFLSANLRQAFVTGYNPPITPSIGMDYQWLTHSKWRSVAKASVSRSYRVPTLNERYWEDIGNPSIRPEHGWSKEVGLELFYQPSVYSQWSTKVTNYHKRIHHWTFWNPLKGNKVENLQEVVAKGIEAEVSYHKKTTTYSIGSSAVYAYTHSSQQKMYDAYAVDVIGKQLPLTPKHTANLQVWWGWKNYRLTGQISAQGKSYQTSEETQPLPSYTLVHVFAENTFKGKRMNVRVQPQIWNLTNAFYLDVRRNALPGRNYAIQLIASFHSK